MRSKSMASQGLRQVWKQFAYRLAGAAVGDGGLQ
jgi:hypothetical protein